MKRIYLTESQFKQICKLIKEEEYTIVHPIGRFNNPMEAQQYADFLRQSNIDAYAKGNEVIIYVEKNWADDNYVQDIIKQAQLLVQQFNNRYRQVNESK